MKARRQAAILDLVRSRDILTQAELTAALAEVGFAAAQATISRDIRELRLTRQPVDAGLKYADPNAVESESPFARAFRDGLVSVDYAGNLLVLRTLSGMGMAVAAALDAMHLPEVLGSVAGDDTVLVVVRLEAQASYLMERLKP